MRIGILGASAALAWLVGTATAGAQTAPCDQCAKLDTINASIEMQTTEVKSIRRQGVDKLVPQVDKLVLQGDALALKVDKLVAAAPAKSAVVIEFAAGVAPPNTSPPGFGQPQPTADAVAAKYCQSINYASGKALGVVGDGPPVNGFPPIRTVSRLVCYM